MAKINTTINFMTWRLDWVVDAAGESGIAYKELIGRCLERFAANFEKDAFADCALKYQEDHDDWKKVHFSLSPDEYDVFFDIKKVSRFSFSLIVAMAVDLYLESVIIQDQSDSYPLGIYTKLCIFDENRPIYIFSWKKMDVEEIISKIQRE
jgi:hypothetical protein